MAGTTPWPPAAGLTSLNVPRESAVISTAASSRISAPAATVFRALLQVDKYPQWNTFCPKVTIQKQPRDESDKQLHIGTFFTFHVVMDEKKPGSYTPTQLLVTDISTPENPSVYLGSGMLEDDSFTADLNTVYRISWKCEGGFTAKGLKAERFHEVIALNENECEVRTWENQGGPLAYTVRWLYKKTLEQKFQLWCNDLKKYCENDSGQTD